MATVTTQSTSKIIKFQMLLSTLGIVGSIVWLLWGISQRASGGDANVATLHIVLSVVTFIMCVIWRILTKIARWWFHD